MQIECIQNLNRLLCITGNYKIVWAWNKNFTLSRQTQRYLHKIFWPSNG